MGSIKQMVVLVFLSSGDKLTNLNQSVSPVKLSVKANIGYTSEYFQPKVKRLSVEIFREGYRRAACFHYKSGHLALQDIGSVFSQDIRPSWPGAAR